ncbi:MAG: pyridoxamine 5'-phosphate oxidase [Burkholderiaceae bacterium]
MSIADIRQNYEKSELLESQAAGNPFDQFAAWFGQAVDAGQNEVNAMTLATATPAGVPSARIVLLKGFDERGFTFFTNYLSRKGQELLENPHASLLFFWSALERQVRLEGTIEKVAPDESDAYYHSRPLGSRLGAWVSEQSRPTTREALEARVAEMTARFGDNPPRPEHWGGYRLVPARIEFWQGRPSRLHDRLLYTRQPDGHWERTRLAP